MMGGFEGGKNKDSIYFGKRWDGGWKLEEGRTLLHTRRSANQHGPSPEKTELEQVRNRNIIQPSPNSNTGVS